MNLNIHFYIKSFTTNDCTVGKLFMVDKTKSDNKIFICCILERPYLENKPFVSCIPGGEYYLKPMVSPKFGQTYFLKSVEAGAVGLQKGKRTSILIHPGNTIKDSTGCLLTGSYFGVLNGKRAVLQSKKAFKKLFNLLDAYEYQLTIERV